MSKTKTLRDSIWAIIASIAACAFVCAGFKIAIFSIPSSLVSSNLSKSAEILLTEGVHQPRVIGADKSMAIDNWALAIELGIAGHGDSPKAAFSDSYYALPPSQDNISSYMIEAFAESVALQNGEIGVGQGEWQDYPRYWHGTAALMRVGLLFMDVNGMRLLCFALISSEIIVLTCLTARIRPGMAFAVAIPMFAISYPIASLTIVYSSSIILALGLCILIAMGKNNDSQYSLQRDKLFFLSAFAAVGAMTAYFDFLGTPLLSFGIPAAFAIALFSPTSATKTSDCTMSSLLSWGVAWGCGYAANWGVKLAISSVICGTNVFANAMETAVQRASAGTNLGGEIIDFWTPLVMNVQALSWWWVVLALILICYIVAAIRSNKKAKRSIVQIFKEKRAVFAGLLLLALLPYIWYLLVENHSYYHWWFTYRLQALTWAAILLGASCLLPKQTLPESADDGISGAGI